MGEKVAVENTKTGFSVASLKRLVPLMGLVLVILIFAVLTKGKSIGFSNLKLISIQALILIIGCVGASFTVSHGTMDLSLGGVLALCGCVFCMVGDVNPVLGVLAALATGVICQLFVMGVHAALRVPAFVGTIAMMFISKGVVAGLSQIRLFNLPKAYYVLDKNWFYYLVLALVLVIGYFLFEFTKIGKYNRAVGSNITAAEASGVSVGRYKAYAFIVAGFVVGVCGMLTAIRGGTVTAGTGTGFEFNVIISMVIGGTSLSGGTGVKLSSAIIGALLLTVLENGLVMIGLDTLLVGLIKGLLFLAAVAVSYERQQGKIIL